MDSALCLPQVMFEEGNGGCWGGMAVGKGKDLVRLERYRDEGSSYFSGFLGTRRVPCSGWNGPIEDSLLDPMLVQLQVAERAWRCTCGPFGLCPCAGVLICMGRCEGKRHLFWWLWTVGSMLSIVCDFTVGAQVISGRRS